MINLEQRKNHEGQEGVAYSRPQQMNHRAQENGRQRQTNMQVSYLIESANDKSALTPALRELLEASFALQTISTRVLAAHLRRSPATIRAEFQQILTIFGGQDRHSS